MDILKVLVDFVDIIAGYLVDIFNFLVSFIGFIVSYVKIIPNPYGTVIGIFLGIDLGILLWKMYKGGA